MLKLDINVVEGYGASKRTVIRCRDIYFIGCWSGTYEETVIAINKKYDGKEAREHITKLDSIRHDTLNEMDGGIVNKALAVVSANGHLDIVKYLVENGADANVNYALKWASMNGHLEVIKYLVEHGADITADGNHALRWASRNGHLEVVKYLVEHGADVTAVDNYAIRWASENGYIEIVEYLK